MSDYRAAFKAACADLGAISALLGFESYPGVDALLRSITDLITANPPTGDAAGKDSVDALFDMQPQLVDAEAGGPEPNIKEIMHTYYTLNGIPADEAVHIVDSYIAAIASLTKTADGEKT